MKTLRILLITILTVFVSVTSAQNFRLGFKLESNSVIVKETESNNAKLIFGSPTSAGVNLSANPLSKLDIELKIGFDFNASYFTGNEVGLFAKYLFADPVYATGGVLFHDVFANKGAPVKAYTNALVFFPSLGLGINLNEHF